MSAGAAMAALLLHAIARPAESGGTGGQMGQTDCGRVMVSSGVSVVRFPHHPDSLVLAEQLSISRVRDRARNDRHPQGAGKESSPEGGRNQPFPWPIVGYLMGAVIGGVICWPYKKKPRQLKSDHGEGKRQCP